MPKYTCLFILFFHILLAPVVGQTGEQQNTRVRGRVLDSLSGSPVAFATLWLQAGNVVAQKTIADSIGGFSFTNLHGGTWQVSASASGYETATRYFQVRMNTDLQDIKLPPFLLKRMDKQLAGVTVTATRPLVKQEIDRLLYDAGADPDNKSLNLLDMLRKVPLLSVDGEDNLLMNGRGNFRILIDGRTSTLFSRNLAGVLRSMPAANILRIEVITTPPSKYEGEGLAGIINIITNKKVNDGYNGNVSGTSGSFYSSLGASINAKSGRLGYTLFAGSNFEYTPANRWENKVQAIFPSVFSLEENGTKLYNNQTLYMEVSAGYEIDSLRLLTATLSLNRSRDHNNADLLTTLLDMNGILKQSAQLSNRAITIDKGIDAGINYQLGFAKRKDRLLTLFYKYASYNTAYDGSNNVSEQYQYPVNDLRQENNSGLHEHQVQVDYVEKIGKVNIETGLRTVYRDKFSDSRSERMDPTSGVFVKDPSQRNDFSYTQGITGVYHSYFLKLKRWGFKAGARLERTVNHAKFISAGTAVDQDYLNILPSVVVQRQNAAASGSVKLAYTQRLQRPGIALLNPFTDQSDPRFYRSGNPGLQPVRIHNFELSYNSFRKATVTVSLVYAFAKNTIQRVSSLEKDSIIRSLYQNVGKSDNLGLNANLNIPLSQAINITVNGGAAYAWLSGVVDGKQTSNEGVQGFVYSYLYYRAKKNWRFSFRSGFYGATINLQGNSNSYFYSSINASRQQLLKGKLAVSASINNPFSQFRSVISSLKTDVLDQRTVDYRYFRNFSITINYSFGKLKSQVKKNSRNMISDDKVVM